jgi:hypothetical protein
MQSGFGFIGAYYLLKMFTLIKEIGFDTIEEVSYTGLTLLIVVSTLLMVKFVVLGIGYKWIHDRLNW